mmetsp:Transcript_39321/g.83770  ORF Transcript_39321/g.83770 Transcript_39321/m.83770 type:complete len:320 (+) Transcript_39321:49-1008(+)
MTRTKPHSLSLIRRHPRTAQSAPTVEAQRAPAFPGFWLNLPRKRFAQETLQHILLVMGRIEVLVSTLGAEGVPRSLVAERHALPGLHSGNERRLVGTAITRGAHSFRKDHDLPRRRFVQERLQGRLIVTGRIKVGASILDAEVVPQALVGRRQALPLLHLCNLLSHGIIRVNSSFAFAFALPAAFAHPHVDHFHHNLFGPGTPSAAAPTSLRLEHLDRLDRLHESPTACGWITACTPTEWGLRLDRLDLARLCFAQERLQDHGIVTGRIIAFASHLSAEYVPSILMGVRHALPGLHSSHELSCHRPMSGVSLGALARTR